MVPTLAGVCTTNFRVVWATTWLWGKKNRKVDLKIEGCIIIVCVKASVSSCAWRKCLNIQGLWKCRKQQLLSGLHLFKWKTKADNFILKWNCHLDISGLMAWSLPSFKIQNFLSFSLTSTRNPRSHAEVSLWGEEERTIEGLDPLLIRQSAFVTLVQGCESG